MITSASVKKLAKSLGADAVGIGNIERWEGVPTQMDPRQIMPEAQSSRRRGYTDRKARRILEEELRHPGHGNKTGFVIQCQLLWRKGDQSESGKSSALHH